MRDKLVRQAFHETILKPAHEDGDTFVVDELGLKNGGIRADIAVINGRLIGYEIKTERDTLVRLSSQVEAYSEVFHKAFVVLSNNHLKKALDFIPDWWGVYTINTESNGSYSFSCYRDAKLNKNQNTFTLAQLLWKTEALEVANVLLRHNVKAKTSKREIYEVISGTCSRSKLSKIIIQYLKQRNNWRTDRLSLLKNGD